MATTATEAGHTAASKRSAKRSRLRERLAGDKPTSAFLPILLVTCAITGLLLIQAAQLYADRSQLAELRASQRPAYKEAQRLQSQLEGVAADTAVLAEQGNANAKLIIEALRSRGINIDPTKR
ncbi:hypothetical protein CKO31_12910 [Thiohalocapsa halophila]|uniref:Cell division protein FtsL n=1 Tax=Thiohalocapsa halophila TaxID=69359 RepID=A0ABS1CI83_9GAMM|nr:hypothetical protein [Thiohalocapsa halophila]MBK1631627.1 hypothetical protein [Thiohalocapsa halophila]